MFGRVFTYLDVHVLFLTLARTCFGCCSASLPRGRDQQRDALGDDEGLWSLSVSWVPAV